MITKRYCLSEIVSINQFTYKNSDGWNCVNYLDTGNITRNSIESIQYIDLSTEKLPSRAKRKVSFNSIIYSTVRPNQLHYGIIKEIPENFLVSTGFAVIDVKDGIVDADYLYYWLTQESITLKLHSIAEQSVSAYPSIKPSVIADLEIDLPDIKTQKQIANILKSLGDKIENNSEINDNLAA